MRYVTGIATILLAVAFPQALTAPTPCERMGSGIERHIINSDVVKSSSTLNTIPNDQADQPDSLVVRHCANDTHKILYTRTNSGSAPVSSSPAQDGYVAGPQQIMPSVRRGLLWFDMH